MTDVETAEDWARAGNPVLSGFYPDPSVCRVDGADGTWYYLASSTFEYLPGLPIHRSRDLVGWELVGHVLDRPGQVDLAPVGDSGGLFAPTIRHDGERFLIVCTVVGGPEGASGNFVATATDAAGPWSDPIWWHAGGIDPSILVDDDGSLWAHGTRLAAEPEWDQQTEVWVRPLDPETLQLGDSEHVVWTGAVRGAVWAEGPHLYRRNGTVYLLAAEGGTGFNHAISMARAEEPTGPFVGCPANPVLSHRQLGRRSPVINVGHADLVDAPDGTSWALCLASRPWHGSDSLGRETFLVDVVWEEGWPVFAPGVGRLSPWPQHPAPVGEPASVAEPVDARLAVRRLPSELGLTDLADGGFTLPAGAGLHDPRPAFVAQRVTRHDSRLQVRVVEATAGVRAGLALRYSGAAYLSATVAGGELVVESAGAGEASTQTYAIEAGTGTVGLEISGHRVAVVWQVDGGTAQTVTEADISALCTEASGGFVGITYGALSIGSGDATFADLQEGA